MGAHASLACMPARWPGRPIRARGRGACRSARCGARLREKGEDEEGRETDEWAPLVSESEEKEKGWQLVGLRLQHGLGRRVRGKGKIRHMLVAKALQIVLKLALS
jgi:hypothetical protein